MILEAELKRVKEAASADFNSLMTDLMAKNRKIQQLNAERTRDEDTSGEAQAIREFLLYWRAQVGRSTRTKIDRESDRWKLAKKQLKRYGLERCTKAVDGLALRPFLGPHGGRFEECPPGGERKDDLEYAIGTDKRIETCEGYVDQKNKPKLAPVQKPEPLRRDTIDDFLEGLTRLGKAWRPSGKDHWMAQCPTHDDRTPSLSINVDAAGEVIWFCQGPCGFDPELRKVVMGRA